MSQIRWRLDAETVQFAGRLIFAERHDFNGQFWLLFRYWRMVVDLSFSISTKCLKKLLNSSSTVVNIRWTFVCFMCNSWYKKGIHDQSKCLQPLLKCFLSSQLILEFQSVTRLRCLSCYAWMHLTSLAASYKGNESPDGNAILAWISVPKKRIESHHKFQLWPFFIFTEDASIDATSKQRIGVKMTYDHRIFNHTKQTFYKILAVDLS